MAKLKKIKSLIFMYIGLLLGVIIVLQIFLYSLLRYECNKIIYSVFDSVAQNTATLIEDLNENVAEISVSLSTNTLIQHAIYKATPADHVKNLKSLQDTVNDYRMRDNNIAMLCVVNKGKVFMSSEDFPLRDTVRTLLKDQKTQNIESDYYTYSFYYNNEPYFAYITPIYPVQISYSLADTYDNFIVAIYKITPEKYMMQNLIDVNTVALRLIDADSKIILSADTNELGAYFESGNHRNAFFDKTVPIINTDWSLNIQGPRNSISLFNNFSLVFVILMLIMYIITLTIILKLLNDIIIKRINKLKTSALGVLDNDVSYRIQYQYDDELKDIALVLNQVLENLHSINQKNIYTLSKLHEAEMLQKETQIIYLTGQISPHFLYNSMSHIQGVALKYNAREIVEIAVSMSKVFRYFSNDVQISNIKQDLDCAIDYFNVVNVRREHPLTIINKVDDSLLNIPCLKMIFQPLLENILKHAFDLEDDGVVVISSIPDNSKAIIDISDNGKGFTQEKLTEIKYNLDNFNLNQLQSRTHIGILNVHTRLRLYYNNDSGLNINSVPGKGAHIKIVFDKALPANRNDDTFKIKGDDINDLE